MRSEWTNAGRVANARSRVLLIYVGGTLGMRRLRPQDEASPLSNVAASEIVSEIQDFGVDQGIVWQLTGLEDSQGNELPPVDSSEVGPRHWICLAAMLERVYDSFDGFVILHGTDTLAYTASALSFLLVNLGKPVVLTGSQLPLFDLRSDARQNLLHALLIAGWRASGLPLVPEVTVCFGDSLLRGNRARKASTSGWQGFHSPNYPVLGSLGERVRIFSELVAPAPAADAAFYAGSTLEDQVLDLTLFPGIRAAQVEALLLGTELRGVVLRAYGAGNAPEDPALLDCLGRAVAEGKTILVVTQCHQGRVDLGRYASSRGLLQRGVASGFDLTPEAALTKLMWVLAQEQGDEVRIQLQLNQRGEQSYARQEVVFPVPDSPGPSGWELTARAAAPLRRQALERAVLQLTLAAAAPVQVYLNVGGATRPGHRIAELEGVEGANLVDVSAGVRRYMVDDRPFHLLVACGEVRLARAELLLTTRS